MLGLGIFTGDTLEEIPFSALDDPNYCPVKNIEKWTVSLKLLPRA
jgi:hypothetical protein